MPIEENGHTSAYNEALRQIRAGLPEHFNFGKGFLEEEEAFKLANIQVAKPKEVAPNTNPIEIRVTGQHKFDGEQVFIVVDGLRYPAAYEPSTNTFLIYLYNTTSFNKIEAILYRKGAAIQRVERVFKGENETGIFSGSAEEDAGQSGFVTGEQFLGITKKYPTTVMALVGFYDKKDADIAVRWYGKQVLLNIIKTACEKAIEIYKENGIDIKFYALSIDEFLEGNTDAFNGLYVGVLRINPIRDFNTGVTYKSCYSEVGMGVFDAILEIGKTDFTYVPKGETNIPNLKNGVAYTLAHEYLHQWLARSEYILYKNLLHMHNEPAGHFNINVKIESASKPYPHLNKEGDSFEAFQRFNSKEYRRIWEGHLFLLKNYSALCNENLDNLLEVLIVKLDTSDKKGKYKSRVKEVIKGIDMPGNIQSNFLSQVFFLPDKKFTKELIENFQFK